MSLIRATVFDAMRRHSISHGTLAALMLACLPAKAEAQAKLGPPSFDNARYGEEYSYLRDPASRTGAAWEPFKFIPLDTTGTHYLTLGADLRARYKHYNNNQWGGAAAPNDGYGWFRVMPYADLHFGPNVRVFGQLIGAWAVDVEPAPSPVDQTGFEFLQAFAQVRFPTDHGGATVQGGRQLLAYGSERLIGLRLGPNVPQAFDGGLGRIEVGPWRWDAFYMEPVKNHLGDFNDRPDGTREVWSLYGTRKLPNISASSGLDMFYIGYRNTLAKFEQGSGEETRHTVGTRFFGTRENLKWDLVARIF